MKSLMHLIVEVLRDRGTWCGVSTIRDEERIAERFEHEGLSFLTTTLPAFGSDLQKGLALGQVARDSFLGWDRVGRLPKFLSGFVSRVFDVHTGLLLDNACPDSIQAIRQITMACGKVQVPDSLLSSRERFRAAAREKAALSRYILCEQDVRDADRHRTEEQKLRFNRMAMMLFGDVFDRLNRMVDAFELIPSHGPGATADRLTGNEKYRDLSWTARLERVFPCGEYAIPSARHWQYLAQLDVLEPRHETPVKVTLVPKDARGPRIIAMEPTAMMFMQQALARELVSLLEADDFAFQGVVGFTDQTPNQRMAEKGSIDGSLATLDMKDASDRVSNQLIRGMLTPWPSLREAIDAARSRKADVPGYGVIRLAKFASMGSALCFPMEAIAFAIMAFLGIENALGRPLAHSDLKRMRSDVRVYGDDLIVPTVMAPSVVESLRAFGAVVNVDKSFWTGRFRESCGREFFKGHDVSITRVRRTLPTRQQDVVEVVSTVSLRNRCYAAGMWGVARWLDDRIRPVLGRYPTVLTSSPVLGRHSLLGYETQRNCPRLHRPLVRGYVVVGAIPEDKFPLDGVPALLKWFLKQSDEPFADVRHLERSGRPRAVSIKLAWSTPF